MKKCPFCAEDIQDAAVVCKHCGRDLDRSVATIAGNQAPVAVVRTKRGNKWPWILGGLMLLFMLFQWSRSDYVEFSKRREDWHRRCDAYRSVTRNSPQADHERAEACQREAEEMVAYAKKRGWAQ